MIFTAEKQRVRKTKSESKLSDEKRIQKLQKLKVLKEKLTELESQKEEQSKQSDTIQKHLKKKERIKTDKDDQYLGEIDAELSNLESELAKEIDGKELKKMQILRKEKEKIHDRSETIERISQTELDNKLSKEEMAEVDAELEKLEKQMELEQNKAAVIVSLFDQLCEEHNWLKEPQYGFMYSMPNKKKNKEDFESWRDDWSKVLFDYAKIASDHIIYSKELLSEKPWSDFKDRTNAIQEISEKLIKKKIAEWLGKKKERLRIYWRSLETWADAIISWVHRDAITEIILINDIRESGEDFSSLPEEDLIKIFKIIEKMGRGEIHKLKDGQVAITIEF
ncbi:MAG: hypothetical protein ACTSWY_11605 [Promethearchaeota archaeon]